MDRVCKCGSTTFFTEQHGNNLGLYCSEYCFSGKVSDVKFSSGIAGKTVASSCLLGKALGKILGSQQSKWR